MLIPPMPRGKYFISHAYKDSAIRDQMLKQLPKSIRPFIFQTVLARPDQMVSNDLIEQILKCDGLIYLDKGYSATSFWVAFERDYALRAGKPVFRYDPDTDTIEACVFTPLTLLIFPAFRNNDFIVLQKLFQIMKDERYIDLFIPPVDNTSGKPYVNWWDEKLVLDNLYKRLNLGGYVVIFWSKNSNESERVHVFLQNAYKFYPSDHPEYHRVLFVLMDQTPLPDWYYQKIEPYLDSAPYITPVQLFPDSRFSQMNRLDNLIVRLYWLIFRNQYPEFVHE